MARAKRPVPVRPPVLNCLACRNRHSTEWQRLDDAVVAEIDRAKVTMHFEAGDVLYYQGNPPAGLYCLESGTVAMRMADEAGNAMLMRLANGGQVFGIADFCSGRSHAVSGEALVPSTVCLIPGPMVRALLERPEIGSMLLDRMGRLVQHYQRTLLNQATHQVRARLAGLLLSLSEHYGERDDGETIALRLPMGRHDLAEMIGSRPETLVRTLRAFQADGLLRQEGRALRILNTEALEAEAEPALASSILPQTAPGGRER